MRPLLAACVAGAVTAAVLLWLAARDLREPWRVTPDPDPSDDVQWDPWTRSMSGTGTLSAVRSWRIDQATGNVTALTPSDRDWLAETRAHLYPAT